MTQHVGAQAAADLLITVLLADDHGVLRDGLRELLQVNADIRVVATATDGEEAVRAATEFQPTVAIMDISMPRLTGIEATRRIQQAAPTVAVVMLSYRAEPEAVREAFRAGARGYVLKDSASDEIVRAVRAVAAGGRHVGSGLPEPMVETTAGGIDALNARERDILRLVAEGQTNAQIGTALGLTTRTVETYRLRLMDKLDIHDVAALVKFALRHGITALE
jgi:DNA-binding NarL/FixJ family response regulator